MSVDRCPTCKKPMRELQMTCSCGYQRDVLKGKAEPDDALKENLDGTRCRYKFHGEQCPALIETRIVTEDGDRWFCSRHARAYPSHAAMDAVSRGYETEGLPPQARTSMDKIVQETMHERGYDRMTPEQCRDAIRKMGFNIGK